MAGTGVSIVVFMRLTIRHLACPSLKHTPAQLVQSQLQPLCDLVLLYPP